MDWRVDMNLKIVKFKNGKYAIRRLWIFGYEYLDLENPGLFWGKRSRHYGDCLSPDYENVKRVFDDYNDNGAPV